MRLRTFLLLSLKALYGRVQNERVCVSESMPQLGRKERGLGWDWVEQHEHTHAHTQTHTHTTMRLNRSGEYAFFFFWLDRRCS